ncbi:MAG TPA: YdcF family protein [Falsiroseomonas sp.]|nr:YdcF family protein [Falsiroseomonas sp.]
MIRRFRWAVPPLVLLAALAGGFLWFLGMATAEAEAPARRTEAIVVLTGGAERVATGLALLEAGLAPRLLVSGAAPRLSMAEFARAHRRDLAMLADRVTLGHAAATTVGNAAETAAWLRAEGIGQGAAVRVVTAGYHMPRALLELRRALPGVELLAHPVGPSGLRAGAMPRARVAQLLVGEYLKYGLALTGLSALVPARS